MEKKLLLASLSLLSASNTVLCQEQQLLDMEQAAEIIEACLAEEGLVEELCQAVENGSEENKSLSDLAHQISQYAHQIAEVINQHAANPENTINPTAELTGDAAGATVTAALSAVTGPVIAAVVGQEVDEAITNTADFILDQIEDVLHAVSGKGLEEEQVANADQEVAQEQE